MDFLGTSIHPAWNFAEYERSEFGLPFAYCLDLLRSASGAAPVVGHRDSRADPRFTPAAAP